MLKHRTKYEQVTNVRLYYPIVVCNSELVVIRTSLQFVTCEFAQVNPQNSLHVYSLMAHHPVSEQRRRRNLDAWNDAAADGF